MEDVAEPTTPTAGASKVDCKVAAIAGEEIQRLRKQHFRDAGATARVCGIAQFLRDFPEAVCRPRKEAPRMQDVLDLLGALGIEEYPEVDELGEILNALSTNAGGS